LKHLYSRTTIHNLKAVEICLVLVNLRAVICLMQTDNLTAELNEMCW